ncbi:MAG: hypothetical protein U0V75_15910 [Ferruginibacter sp.]
MNSVPGKWNWDKRGGGDVPASAAQWQYCDPIRKELQRIMPVAIEGLYATNSIAFTQHPAIPNTAASPKNYECYLMLKKYECLKGYNQIQPEGETGCWVYFIMNGMRIELPSLQFGFHANEGSMYIGDFSMAKDAAGNRVVYASSFSRQDEKMGYYFSAADRLPVRSITWKELVLSYKLYAGKEIANKLVSEKDGLARNEKELAGTKTADTKKYLTDLVADRKQRIAKLEADNTALENWYARSLQHQRIHETARVNNSYLDRPQIEKLMNEPAAKGTFPVWINDISFFDAAKPKDAPQCIFLWYRRQDNERPKFNFMELFVQQFNLDVLHNMTGEAIKNPAVNNTLSGSASNSKPVTASKQQSANAFLYDVEKTAEGEFPQDWQGMKNVSVQPFENRKWLKLNQDGYWYPRQYNKEIRDHFSLSFDLRWNKDISYNSGLFTVSFCSFNYDNAAEKFETPGNIMSLYDGYTGGFNRVMCWFDPYWNNGGSLEIYSYGANESIVARTKVTLPGFSRDKNNQQLRIERSGNALVVYINETKVTAAENIFLPQVKYNAYTFSRYKGNNSDNKNDAFYINNIHAGY